MALGEKKCNGGFFQSNKKRFQNLQICCWLHIQFTDTISGGPKLTNLNSLSFQLEKEILNVKVSAFSWLSTIPFAHLQNVQGSWMQCICQNKWPKKFSCMNGRGKKNLAQMIAWKPCPISFLIIFPDAVISCYRKSLKRSLFTMSIMDRQSLRQKVCQKISVVSGAN